MHLTPNANHRTRYDMYDVVIIGAGASGLMCAIRAGQRDLSVLVIEKSHKIGQKILISGGGRCNFTNWHISPEAYLSPNPHFCKSALSRYSNWHFIELLERYHLTYHEKTLGQLFCDQRAKAIVDMLVSEATSYGVHFALEQHITAVTNDDAGYYIATETDNFSSKKLVIACGSSAFPKLGASDFALRLAKQFAIKNTPFTPALVPFLVPENWARAFKGLAGVAVPASASVNGQTFHENLLFTHRGLSGPVILQISSYWQKGDAVTIDLAPQQDLYALLTAQKAQHPKQQLSTALSQCFPKKLATAVTDWFYHESIISALDDKTLADIARACHAWEITPSGTEGMKKAEVCTGGIHPDALSSKTFEVHKQKGLYAIGEAVDVTGWLGGYNFQWAWSSGWCCGDSL